MKIQSFSSWAMTLPGQHPKPPAPGHWRLAGLRVERDAPQSSGPWHPPHLVRFPPTAHAQVQAEITPPAWEGSAKGKKPGSKSASGKRSLVPTLGPGKSACSVKFGSASQLRQGAHQNTRREQRFASCSGLGFLSGNTCNILLAEGVGAGRGRPCNRCRCSCRAGQRLWRPGRLSGLLGVN